jgi:FMN hydrolase / 5-amino-6-(5-phospho-D-ribitylamino)uracil phosphatase
MRRFDVVSLDMFQTLVNVESCTNEVWRPILQDSFTEEVAAAYAAELLEHFFEYWGSCREAGEFSLMRRVYQNSFEKQLDMRKLKYDSEEAVTLLFRGHKNCSMYEETPGFLERLTKEYPVVIISDADDDMVPEFYRDYSITLFTSEFYKSYKNDTANAMFQELLRTSGASPGRIIHVGDSASDVLGARRAGIAACWLNRNGQAWPVEGVEPDYMICRLDDLFEILDAE